jgi:hypothetical protein
MFTVKSPLSTLVAQIPSIKAAAITEDGKTFVAHRGTIAAIYEESLNGTWNVAHSRTVPNYKASTSIQMSVPGTRAIVGDRYVFSKTVNGWESEAFSYDVFMDGEGKYLHYIETYDFSLGSYTDLGGMGPAWNWYEVWEWGYNIHWTTPTKQALNIPNTQPYDPKTAKFNSSGGYTVTTSPMGGMIDPVTGVPEWPNTGYYYQNGEPWLSYNWTASKDTKVSAESFGYISLPAGVSSLNRQKLNTNGSVMLAGNNNGSNGLWVYRKASSGASQPVSLGNYKNWNVSGDGLTICALIDVADGVRMDVYKYKGSAWSKEGETTLTYNPNHTLAQKRNVTIWAIDYTGSVVLLTNNEGAGVLYIYK